MNAKSIASFLTAAVVGALALPANTFATEGEYPSHHRSNDDAQAIVLAPHSGAGIAFDQRNQGIIDQLPLAGNAGDVFDNPALSLTYTHTEFEDDALAVDGDVDAVTLSISGYHGDNIVGIGFTADQVDADGGIDIDTSTLDGYYGFRVTDAVVAGVIATVSFVDAGPGGDDHQTGIGPFLSGGIELGDSMYLGATGSVLYLDTIGDQIWLFDLLVDLAVDFTDVCGASVYLGYTDAADDNIAFEDYFTAGVDASYARNDAVSFTAGYETTLGHDDVDDHTFLFSGTLSF